MIERAFGIVLLLGGALALPVLAAEQVRIAHNNLLPPFSEAKDGKTVGLVVDIFLAAGLDDLVTRQGGDGDGRAEWAAEAFGIETYF